MGVIEVQTFSLWQVTRAVEDLFRGFGDSFLTHCDLVVQITRLWHLRYFSDLVGWDAPRLHGGNPVVDSQLVLVFLQELFQLLALFSIGVEPAIVLYFNDHFETLVLWEGSEDSLKIFLVQLEDF